jgi:hypothetical protein
MADQTTYEKEAAMAESSLSTLVRSDNSRSLCLVSVHYSSDLSSQQKYLTERVEGKLKKITECSGDPK